ncbi:class I SAM-dependent methyltransferase [Kitasatospora kifunensis]|uniref:Cyclopropane fatty-acyl-phospholipid synthase-like methyltransferase n=1 Tax=Kitasatospora kifunensis TaxID=58351 RepID=A0A7W7R104_KITKI|nr:class I SAM-dependent methyltransferase [Kitasatospora kifunensis]MBB4923466.1 cyclopropane fatty-acyl-phospholipid synthase-like methyltransferase [Kitasatospora kifunensis]
MAEVDPITVDEMYTPRHPEGAERILNRSFAPRRAGLLYALVDDLDIGPGNVVLDIGGRDASHSIALVKAFGCDAVSVDPVDSNNERARAAVAEASLTGQVSIRPGVMEEIPAADGEFDLIFSRDMFFHVVGADQALAEARRVLKPGGCMVLYQTFATDRLEPLEKAQIYAGLAVAPERMSPDDFEKRALVAGFTIESNDIIGSEWREAWEEEGDCLTSRQLLYAARMIRKSEQLRAELGEADYRVELANALWGIYTMIGKLEPRIFLLRNPE